MVKTPPQPGIHSLNQSQTHRTRSTLELGHWVTGIHSLNQSQTHRTRSTLELGHWVTGIHSLNQSQTHRTRSTLELGHWVTWIQNLNQSRTQSHTEASAYQRQVYVPANQNQERQKFRNFRCKRFHGRLFIVMPDYTQFTIKDAVSQQKINKC